MRSLNSILIEGELSTNPDWDRLRCVFTLRVAQQDFAGVVTHFEIPVVIAQRNLAQSVMVALKSGDAIRCVGKLSPVDDVLSIIPEHIEYNQGGKDR
ncbi:MAG: hypothetical protein CVV46_03675 [Spirochaetae bacterium HGW-Spirochaetae-2]|nr:MAG: hypothetical protein CVV46_03675 [Spirochaetae bacterium HGW-Spirochaetae-2]